MGLDVFVDFISIEGVLCLQTSNVVVLYYIGFVEFQSEYMILPHEAVVLGFLELLECLDDVGKHFDLLLLGQFGVEVVGLEGLPQQRQHH